MTVEVSPETGAFLEHFGVKGMQWGKRKAEGGDATPAPAKRTREDTNAAQGHKTAKEAQAKFVAKSQKHTSEQIHNARQNTDLRVQKIFEADAQARIATTAKGKAAAMKQVDYWAKQINEHPDSYIAQKKTKGEKAAQAVILAMAAVSIGSIIVSGRH